MFKNSLVSISAGAEQSEKIRAALLLLLIYVETEESRTDGKHTYVQYIECNDFTKSAGRVSKCALVRWSEDDELDLYRSDISWRRRR